MTTTITRHSPLFGMEQSVDEQFFHDLLSQLDEGVYFVDTQRCISYWNTGAEKISGYSAEEMLGSNCAYNALMHVDDEGKHICHDRCPLKTTMADGESREVNLYLRHKEGHRVPVTVRTSTLRDEHGRVIGGIEVFSHNPQKQTELERIEELERLTFRDSLTGVANRRHLQATLESRFAEFQRNNSPFGLILVDVDQFQHFNDRHGYEIGDRVLQMVAKTLSTNCGPYDSVGRWDGEEFLVIATNVALDELVTLAEQLRSLIAGSNLIIDNRGLRITVSAGVTIIKPEDDVESLIQRVATLLEKCKQDGRNRVKSG